MRAWILRLTLAATRSTTKVSFGRQFLQQLYRSVRLSHHITICRPLFSNMTDELPEAEFGDAIFVFFSIDRCYHR
ncbi:hypothetical protein FN846DRAFT_60730 [Sphaerosporella brunnea]|uniref:Uncharacterized protein n=1 Tax=Sphaerosporella brunnea TaxID=1250544 RepID=A0A5J5F8Y9_9PEZI|nr:hypothetical protein FN846DRAFT_60730 [Sphaerosporella brunnea]